MVGERREVGASAQQRRGAGGAARASARAAVRGRAPHRAVRLSHVSESSHRGQGSSACMLPCRAPEGRARLVRSRPRSRTSSLQSCTRAAPGNPTCSVSAPAGSPARACGSTPAILLLSRLASARGERAQHPLHILEKHCLHRVACSLPRGKREKQSETSQLQSTRLGEK